MLLPNACRHPNRNGFFFEGLSKQSDVTTLTWGEGGVQVSSPWVWHDGGCFWRTRTQSGKDFVVYGCANTSLNKLPFAFATTSIQTHSHLQSCYPANKEAQDVFCFMAVQTQAWSNSLLHSPKPNRDTLSSSQLLPTNKECASRSRIAQTACFAQCTHSARYSARPQNAVNTMGLALFGQLTENATILSFLRK